MIERGKTNDHIDYSLLLFIIGVTYVKLYVKIAAVLFFAGYLLYKHYKPTGPVRLTWFYFLMPVVGTIGSVLHGSFSETGYWFGWAFGFSYWILAGISSYLLYVAVINTSRRSLHKTLKAFFAVNFIVSIVQLINLMIMSRHLVPYWYWDATEYFGSSTGDHIQGVFSSISVTNAMVSALGCLYFLYKKNLFWSISCMLVMLLCTSNLTLVFFVTAVVLIFIFVGIKHIRWNAIILILITGLVYPMLSPQNVEYVDTVYVQETTPTPAKPIVSERPKRKPWYVDREEFKVDNVSNMYSPVADRISFYRLPLNQKKIFDHAGELKYMHLSGNLENKEDNVALLDTNVLMNVIAEWYGMPYDKTPLATYQKPIKLYSNLQTLFFLYNEPLKNSFGAGIGNFSSKQALKMLGIEMQGSYPTKYTYLSTDFLRYHLYSFLYVFSLPISEHSIINMINSVYNQVGGEYGIIGLGLFLLLYIGYFWQKRQNLSKLGYTIIPITLLFFNFEYWFEMLSLTVIFEMLIFIDIYKQNVEE